jgi:hypothetical protein
LAAVLERETQAEPTREKKFLLEIWGFWDGSSSRAVSLEECSLLGNHKLNNLVREIFAFEVSRIHGFWKREKETYSLIMCVTLGIPQGRIT